MFSHAGELAGLIDHTRLAPDTMPEDIRRACREARRYGFASVCIPPCYVEEAVRELDGSKVAVGTVIGFPLGYQSLSVKIFETMEAVKQGAIELDLVIHLGAVKIGDARGVRTEVGRIRDAASGARLKVILETGYLSRKEMISACLWSREAGAVWVKTSTGFGPKGATTADVRRLKKAIGEDGFVKAAGGIRDLKSLEDMVRAGASRIGTSRGVEILKEYLRGSSRS
ncbi:MAG TPA: deoxyribose-phosphate aldolase [Nitrospiria bacterium]|jgi:deoxyribose-phosphate aldolase|nr:deoxyribose-phosphate aldolase [Nitrospiria bacterium]